MNKFYDKRRFSGFLAMAITVNFAILKDDKERNGAHYRRESWDNFHSLTYGLDLVYNGMQ